MKTKLFENNDYKKYEIKSIVLKNNKWKISS